VERFSFFFFWWGLISDPGSVGFIGLCRLGLFSFSEETFRQFFYFFYFLFLFFTKIYFCFQNLQKYTPAAPLQGGRDLVAPLLGGRGFSAKNFAENLR